MARRSNAAKTGAKPEKRATVKTTSARAKASSRWRGDAVEAGAPAGQSAEEAAARAEGNAPLPGEAVANGEDRGTFPDQVPRRRPARGADDAENAEEKRQSAAEDHAQGPSRGPIHGRL